MIHSFADTATADLYAGRFGKPDFPIAVIRIARRKLAQIHAARSLEELARFPGNRLERLRGNLAGFQSIRVNDQWRIVFQWTRSGATQVQLTDYH